MYFSELIQMNTYCSCQIQEGLGLGCSKQIDDLICHSLKLSIYCNFKLCCLSLALLKNVHTSDMFDAHTSLHFMTSHWFDILSSPYSFSS